MILLRLSDGLGNQLFQYAAGETLRQRTGARIRYLTDAFASRRARADRPLLLSHFVPCQDDLVADKSIAGLLGKVAYRTLRGRKEPVSHLPRAWHICRIPGYTPDFDSITNGMMVTGFFQARQCVEEALPQVKTTIRHHFGPQLAAASARLRERFGDQRLLALHMRLGDYLTIGDGREAIVPLERIHAILQQARSDAQVVLFTDSPALLGQMRFARSVIPLASDDMLQDFANMAACDDFIIANSTFSWWASQLGAGSDKTIWAPRNWHRPAREDPDAQCEIYLPEHRLY